ncbi:MAG: hypothetical protein M3296_11170 [Actinomycetota bacterium]|nr:hypothetical protein [Actinomycetota bacterium]
MNAAAATPHPQSPAGDGATSASVTQRRSTEPAIASAIDLGWRLAALHALSPTQDTPPAPDDDLLLNRRSLPARDRIELDLRALAGDAARAGLALPPEELDRLLDLGGHAAESAGAEEAFRQALARCHVGFDKDLWAMHEARGKAYEVGIFVCDTFNRVLRPRATPETELIALFAARRVERMKLLLDDLQGRLDPAAVHAVQTHLDSWRERVTQRLKGRARAAEEKPAATRDQIRARYEPLERQTIIWRQMLTGAKEPEAFINRDKRGEVRDELMREVRKRYLRYWWALLPIAALGAAVGLFVVNSDDAIGPVAGVLATVGGTLGISQASMIAAVRTGMQSWGELMWHRSLAAVICRETSTVDELFPTEPAPARGRDRRPRREAPADAPP